MSPLTSPQVLLLFLAVNSGTCHQKSASPAAQVLPKVAGLAGTNAQSKSCGPCGTCRSTAPHQAAPIKEATRGPPLGSGQRGCVGEGALRGRSVVRWNCLQASDTVAILAQGTLWAVALSQAFFIFRSQRTFDTMHHSGATDTLAERLRRRPAKPMGSPRVGSHPTGVARRAMRVSSP